MTAPKILLATDLSPASDDATDWGFDLAIRTGGSLLVVSVIDPHDLRLPGGGFRARMDQVRERREELIEALVERGQQAKVPVSFLVWEGDPAESIVAAAQAEAVDLVVVGTHGRGAIGRLLIGSVSEHIVRHAPCPVTVVRAIRPAGVPAVRAERHISGAVGSAYGGPIENTANSKAGRERTRVS
jgi:nucleotide-binding universal stress UspA family protein